MLTPEDRHELAIALRALIDTDRFAGCSDHYFRQVFTARIEALRASGICEKLDENEVASDQWSVVS